MDHHRLLYKTNLSALSPTNQRKAVHENRARKRSELYSSTRNISLSPAPKVEEVSRDDKENFKPPTANTSLKAKDASIPAETASSSHPPPTKINEKESRQKAFVLKFLAWKAEKAKREQLEKEKLKRAPFVVPTGRPPAVEANIKKKTSFAPKGHVFHPPSNLKDVTLEVVGKNTIRCINGGEQETYHFVETPKKKLHSESKVTSVRAASSRAVLAKPLLSSRGAVRTTPNPAQKSVKPAAARFPTPNPVQKCLKPAEAVAPGSSRFPTPNPVQKSLKSAEAAAPGPSRFPTAKSVQKSLKQAETAPAPSRFPTRNSAKTPSAVSNVSKPVALRSKTPIRPLMPPPTKPLVVKPQNNFQNPKMPPPPQLLTRNSRKPHTSTVATASSSNKLQNSKTGLPPLKRPAFKAAKKCSTSISHAVVALKANPRAKSSVVPPTFKLNGKSLLQSLAETTKLVDPIPETPTDSNPDHSYINFVTSTKRKSSSSKDLRADLLFAELGNTISPVEDTCPAPVETKPKEPIDGKFNFVRYSIVQSDKAEPAKPVVAEKPKTTEEALTTPEKTAAAPTTYLSPYVSVSRGKVNTKIEKEKRNSIYMPQDDKVKSPDTTAAMRRTLATVRYYRKQLMDEIGRLDAQCHNWEQYKENNVQLIEDGGVDMINVTIGQTKLLTTKKLKQFGGLIDRCEDGVLGRTSVCSGGDEGSKLILPEDLEGFWSMVGLQIENVDKRFANLDRWKANNWTDPDEVMAKPSSILGNAKKAKKRKPIVNARPNGGLQKMLKAAHAAYLNKKAVGGADEDVILTPSKSRQVVIKNRRSRSAAATVITVNTPRRKSSPLCRAEPTTDLNETPKHVPQVSGYRKSVNLLKSTLLSELDKKSPANEFSSPIRKPVMSRKSILKTPGSISRPKRSVIFNSPPLKFTIEDTVGTPWADPQQQQQKEEDQRTYKLRNRRIVLRDSAEFVIPK